MSLIAGSFFCLPILDYSLRLPTPNRNAFPLTRFTNVSERSAERRGG
jgi:hypothetical protein